MLDAARRATEGALLATDVAVKRLKAGKDEDPARTAANLSRVAQSATDKRLALQGRSTAPTDVRDAMEILRGLVAMGVLQAPSAALANPEVEPQALTEGDVVDN